MVLRRQFTDLGVQRLESTAGRLHRTRAAASPLWQEYAEISAPIVLFAGAAAPGRLRGGAVDCIDLDLAGPRLLVAAAFHDARGFFLESYSRRTLLGFGIDLNFVQDNQSYSKHRGTVRGLHYQSPPYAQAKLIRVVRGRIVDVVVDVRRGSPTYGGWAKAELSAENGHQLLVPVGFLHGFLTNLRLSQVAPGGRPRSSVARATGSARPLKC